MALFVLVPVRAWTLFGTGSFTRMQLSTTTPLRRHSSLPFPLFDSSSSSWGDPDKIQARPSYSDHWLHDFHNRVQNSRILSTNQLAPWNQQLRDETASIREWQEAFVRNNFSDFTPPIMGPGMRCLMVGADMDLFQAKLPWEDEAEAAITSLKVLHPSKENNGDNANAAGGSLKSGSSIQTQLVSLPQQPPSPSKDAAVYDCIFDQGLLEAVLDQPDAVRALLLEAATALREHGIYVLQTRTLNPNDRELLTLLRSECGLEWEFALDGISNNERQVSVARRFNAGPMPAIGRLASRYQPY